MMAESHQLSKITNPRITAILAEIDGGNVLDLGCVSHDPSRRSDPNWLHQYIYQISDSCTGADLDKRGVEKLQEAGYNVVVSDAEQLNFDTEFDYIVAGELIEHLNNPGKFLEAAKARLSKNGKLIMTTPNPWCLPRLKKLVKSEVDCNPDHTHYQDAQTIKQLLCRYGYKCDIKYVGPMTPGITQLLHNVPIIQFKRLGSPHLLVIAESDDV